MTLHRGSRAVISKANINMEEDGGRGWGDTLVYFPLQVGRVTSLLHTLVLFTIVFRRTNMLKEKIGGHI
jgi:hypothetical protein